jgi:hypothetical protein
LAPLLTGKADSRQLQALQVMRRVHPLMKDADNRDAAVSDAEINHRSLDIAAVIVAANMIRCSVLGTTAALAVLALPRSRCGIH